MYDDTGKAYIDAMASLWYANIGYGREEMAEVIAEQVRTLGPFHTFAEMTNEPAEALAERVADVSPYSDPRVFLCGSGSEAVDSALKLARAAQARSGHPERVIVISRDRAYHGVAYGGTSLSGLAVNQEGYAPFVGSTTTVDADDPSKLEATLAQNRGEVAAVITEPVQGAGGVWPPPPGYLGELRRLCDEHEAYLIFDEVITGFGRLGSWFAAERYGVVPDMITFAKGVTSGYLPLGGVLVGPAVRRALEADPEYVLRHGFTYSGHPTVATAALQNLEIIDREGLLERALVIENELGGGLRRLEEVGLLSAVRGVGGMWAVETAEPDGEIEVSMRMRAQGVLARAAYGSLIFCPPRVITDDEIDSVLSVLERTLTFASA